MYVLTDIFHRQFSVTVQYIFYNLLGLWPWIDTAHGLWDNVQKSSKGSMQRFLIPFCTMASVFLTSLSSVTIFFWGPNSSIQWELRLPGEQHPIQDQNLRLKGGPMWLSQMWGRQGCFELLLPELVKKRNIMSWCLCFSPLLQMA